MKNLTLGNNRKMLLALAVFFSALMAGAVTQLQADEWGGHHRYNNQDGFWDGQHHYHQYDHYHNHRGYWDQRNGATFFISVG